MRVIAGRFRNRRLQAPRGLGIRPTSDRLRETLFNVLAPAVADSVWIDLYAGTGAVGIEALSRGARQVYFVEASKKAAQTVRRNLQSLGISQGFELLERDAAEALRRLESEGVVCDFCFVDPPYRIERAYAQALEFLAQSRLLRRSSIVVAEHQKHFDPGEAFGPLTRHRTLRQGDAVLSFYRLG